MTRSQWIPLGILIVLPLLVYAHSLTNDFVAFDDELLIIDNPTARGLNWQNVKEAFTTYDPELYVPLTLLTYQIEFTLFELNPVAYHVTSLVLHLLSGLLVFGIFQFFFDRKIALVLGLLFTLHPMNVEAVAWASGRKDLLASMFFLLSLWLYLRWRDVGNGYMWSVTAFATGLLAKVSIVPLPFVLLLIDWFKDRPINRETLREKLPYFALALLFIVIALFGKSQAKDIWTWVLLSFVSIPFYIGKYIIPWNLSIFYPFTQEVSITNPTILLGLLATTAIVIATTVSVRWSKQFAFAGLWFLLLLAPSFPTVLKGGPDSQIYLYLATDRYVYLAGLGILFLIGFAQLRIQTEGAGVRPAQKNRRRNACSRMLWASCLGAIAVFALLTYRQSMTWATSEALFRNVIDQGRPSFAAYLNLAGFEALKGKHEEAIALYEKSAEIRPTSTAMLNLAQILANQDRHLEAIEVYKEVLDRWPKTAGVHLNIGTLYMYEGDGDRAFPYLLRAVELEPSLIPAHFNLGIIYEYREETDKAIEAFETVLELDPTDEQARRKLKEYGRAGSE